MKSHHKKKSENYTMPKSHISTNTPLTLYQLEKKIFNQFKMKNCNTKSFYYVKIINEIISNDTTHMVAEYKDYLIYGDMTEFFHKYYSRGDSKKNLPKIFEYYDSCSVIFPNYVILPESKFIYKNIQRKQKVIDNQQILEQKLELKKVESSFLTKEEDSDKVFDTRQLDSLLNLTNTSMVNKFLGVNIIEKDKDISINKTNNKSIDDLIDKLTKVEANVQHSTDRYIHNKKNNNTEINKYANCTTMTTTTKEKRNKSRGMPNKKKMIISNILSSDKDILMKAIKNVRYYKSARPLSNENSTNASRYKDNRRQISTSSSKNTLLINQKGINLPSPNILLESKKDSIFHKPSHTSRASRINTEIIKMVSSKILKIKKSSQKILMTQFNQPEKNIKKTMSSLSTVASSLTQKVSQGYYQGKDKKYENLYDKYENLPRMKKINNNTAVNHKRDKIGSDCKRSVSKNNKSNHQISLSPSKHNEKIARTCSHLLTSESYNKNKKKKPIIATIPHKDTSIKGIHIKGFEVFLKQYNSRNKNSLTDRISHKKKRSLQTKQNELNY